MKSDFDLRKVIAADASGAFQSSLEKALDEMTGRLEMRRSVCRDAMLRDRIDALLSACETGRCVVQAAYDAGQAT